MRRIPHKIPQDVHLPLRDIRLLSWQATLEGIARDVQKALLGSDPELADMSLDIWLRYVSGVYTDLPKIVKRSVWAAALEYVTRRTAGRVEPQAMVAARYDVSVKALARAAHAITLAL